MSRGGSAGDNRWLFAVLGVLGISIVGLIIGNVILAGQGQGDSGSEQETLVEETEYVETNGQSLMEEVQEYIALTDGEIAAAQSNEDKVAIYKKRDGYLSASGEFGEFADQIIADAISVDEIEKSIESAGQVANMANSYGRIEIANRYQEIMRQRMQEQGINAEEMEGRG